VTTFARLLAGKSSNPFPSLSPRDAECGGALARYVNCNARYMISDGDASRAPGTAGALAAAGYGKRESPTRFAGRVGVTSDGGMITGTAVDRLPFTAGLDFAPWSELGQSESSGARFGSEHEANTQRTLATRSVGNQRWHGGCWEAALIDRGQPKERRHE
jgi:hypothetical protein